MNQLKIQVTDLQGKPRIMELVGPLAVHISKHGGNVLEDAGTGITWFFTVDGLYDGNGQALDAV